MRSFSRIFRKHLNRAVTQYQNPHASQPRQPNLVRYIPANADSPIFSPSLLSSRDFSYSRPPPTSSRPRSPLNIHSKRRKESTMSTTDPNFLAVVRNMAATRRSFFPWTRDKPYTQPYFTYDTDRKTWLPSTDTSAPSPSP